MSNVSNSSRTRRQIRVISGPLHGTVHTIKCQLHIGRAGSSDIQLLDDDVSRQHAEVVENAYGDHILVDLESSNGTVVDGQPIRRVTLEPGMVFEIMRTRFVYEDAAEEQPDQSSTNRRVPTDLRSLRETTDHGTADLPAPVTSPRPQNEPWAKPPTPHASQYQIRAIDDEGVAYEGDLVGDVREFRQLLSRSLRGMVRDDLELQRLKLLESRLRLPAHSAQASGLPSSYRRFFCSVPSRVRFAAVGSIPAVVIDFGVDGAQILSYQHGLLVNSVVWLSLDVVQDGHPRTVVFTSRIHWSSNNYAGLLFAGEPVQSSADRAASRMSTKRDLSEQAKVVRAALGPLDLRRRNTST